ncbi:peptidoglycan-binding protein [Streptomyces sp. NPDC001222]|uniref:peptidoglycan-binding domain-containing protein n=1 Tax=Streptomyces sp. NPDC001222 TaxID=3364548 RepID=UPI0036BA2290
MSGSNERACPECEAPRRPDGTPSCGCAQRASDALRDARTAQAAAAGDFDPLLIRPYVEFGALENTRPGPGGSAAEDAGASTPDGTLRRPAVSERGAGPADQTMPLDTVPPAGPADETMPLGTVPRLPHSGTAPGSGGTDETMPLGTVPRLPHSGTAPGSGGTDETMRLDAVPDPEAPDDEPPPRRRRRAVLLAAGGAVTVAVAAAALVGGPFSYRPPQRDGALPGDIRASVPEDSPEGGTSAPGSTVSAPAPASHTPQPPSTGHAPSSAPPSSAAATPSASPTPRGTTAARATATASPSQGGVAQQHQTQVLRPGDEGPGVKELQLRLRQLNLYVGPADGVYDDQVEYAVRTYQVARGVTQDDPGVYGPQTRAKLESETDKP